jgi:hypothetical protein
VTWRGFNGRVFRGFTREGARAIARCSIRVRAKPTAHAVRSPSAFRRLSVCSICDLLRKETHKMAMDFVTRNRTNVRFENKVGTNIESLARIFGECFCASGD